MGSGVDLMSEYGNYTLDEYRDALASNSPTPGGGTAAAVALSQGAALALMVCNLTEGREKWKEGWAAAEICRGIAEPLLELGHQLASDDAQAFDHVMLAYKMPKNSDEEIEQRKSAIQKHTLNAAMIPMQTARAAFDLLQTLHSLASTGNSNAVTDVGVASLLVSAACKGALFNVEINISSLSESEEATQLRCELDDLRIKCRNSARDVMHAVHDRIQS